MSDYGHAMFTDDKDRVENCYGKYEHHYDGQGGVKIEDLYVAITEAWDNTDDWDKPYFCPPVTAEDVCEMLTPDDIVDSAQGFDDGPLVQWFWENVLDGPGIFAVITPDGAVVFDADLIKTVA